jgi:hypothetical protein
MSKQLATKLYSANLGAAARLVDLGRLGDAVRSIEATIAECERDGVTYGAVYTAAKSSLPLLVAAEKTRALSKWTAARVTLGV